MKIIKITSLGCPSCIIMNNIIEELTKEYNLQVESYDYDFDDIDKFKVGKVLPVIIFEKNNEEVSRLVGEHSKLELIEVIEKLGD